MSRLRCLLCPVGNIQERHFSRSCRSTSTAESTNSKDEPSSFPLHGLRGRKTRSARQATKIRLSRSRMSLITSYLSRESCFVLMPAPLSSGWPTLRGMLQSFDGFETVRQFARFWSCARKALLVSGLGFISQGEEEH